MSSQAFAAVWFNLDTLMTGATRIRLRHGGRLHLDGLANQFFSRGGDAAGPLRCCASARPSFLTAALGAVTLGLILLFRAFR